MKIKTNPDGSSSFEKPHIDEGIYEGKLKEVKPISDGQYGKRVSFIFEVLEAGKTIAELAHVVYVPEVATPENKFGKALLSLGVDLGPEVETDALSGNTAKVIVEDYEYEQDGKAKLGSTISKVKPIAPVEKV